MQLCGGEWFHWHCLLSRFKQKNLCSRLITSYWIIHFRHRKVVSVNNSETNIQHINKDLNALLSKGEQCNLNLLGERAHGFNLKAGIQVLSHVPSMNTASLAELELRYHWGCIHREVECEFFYHQFL